MFDRLSTGWDLAKQSMHVLKLDKELLVFPVLSGIACSLVVASFALPMYFTGMFEGTGEEQLTDAQKILYGVLGFAFYFANYFVIIFFNSALVACAIIRLKGGDPTVGDGFGASLARLPQIVGWALVAATVGIILKAIESRSEKVGQIVAGLLGMAWSITTYFVVPVLVVERAGPVAAITRSAAIMKNTWGESLGAKFGIGFITFLAGLLAVIPIIGGIALTPSSALVGGMLIGAGVLWILVVSLVSSALGSILLAALYVFAAEGKAPELFDESMVRGAFGPK